jgi:tetratricopeptide (TPR) repeat protein
MRAVRSPVSVLCLALAFVLALGSVAVRAADKVPVRAGVHPGYGRIVFDWPTAVGHSASIDGRQLTVRFDRAISTTFGAVRRTLDGYVASIGPGPDGKSVVATLKNEFRLRTSRSGNRVVVDLVGTALGSTVRAAATPPPRPAGSARPAAAPPRRLGPHAAVAAPVRLPVRVGRNEQYGRLVFTWPRVVPFTVDHKGQAVTIRFAASARLDMARLRAALPPQISAVAVEPAANELVVALTVANEAQLRYFHAGTDAVFDVVAPAPAVAAARSPRRLDPAATSDGRPAKPRPRRIVKERKTPEPLVSVATTRRGAEMVISFNWRHPVAAAVFQRDSTLWVVFDQPARLDMGPVRITGKALLETVEQKPVAGGSAVRLAMTMRHNVAVRRDGTVWVVELGPSRKPAGGTIPLDVARDPQGGTYMRLATGKPGAVLVLKDADVGDSLYVAPLSQPVRGIQGMRRYSEFELLHSAHGIAVHPLDERIRVGPDDAGVTVSRPGGLTLSDAVAKAVVKGKEKGPHRLLDFAAWLYGDPEDFNKIESGLLRYVTQPNGVRRNAARLGLARFYVAHGMGPEALGVIAALLRDDPILLQDPSFRALRGVSRYLIGHYAEASMDFDHPLLRAERQLDPWRAGIAAARGDWVTAHRLMENADGLIAEYPPRFATQFSLIATEAALSVDDLDAASVRLSVLQASSASTTHAHSIVYLHGHLLKKQDEPDRAVALWKQVVEVGDRPNRAKASLALTNTLLDRKKIRLVEAIERLEQLKFAWRDDVFEFDLLHRLSTLYAQNKDFRQALVTLRLAAIYFKDIKGAKELTKEMAHRFRDFFFGSDAEAVPPVVALGLFNEFRELTPPGADGDRLIRRLTERLIAVDLLADAGVLLDHLVRFRLKGAEKAEAGARLAGILLADRKPEKALVALKESTVPDAGDALEHRRRYIEIHALAEAGKVDDAVALLGRDTSDDAEFLRARLQWRAGEWRQASLTLARITGGFSTEKVSEEEAELLLRRAVALALSGNRDGIAFLRQRFGAAMAASPRKAEFDAVVGRTPAKTDDYAVLARQAGELDTFSAFMDRIRPGSAGNGQAPAIN